MPRPVQSYNIGMIRFFSSILWQPFEDPNLGRLLSLTVVIKASPLSNDNNKHTWTNMDRPSHFLIITELVGANCANPIKFLFNDMLVNSQCHKDDKGKQGIRGGYVRTGESNLLI